MKITPRPILALLLAAAPLVSVRAVDDRSAYTKAVASSRIYGFMEILRNSGLPGETVNGAEVTLLIPVDTAFYTLPAEQYRALLAPENKELAARYIRAHVVAGRFTLAELAAGKHLTLGGVELKVTPPSATEPGKINGRRVTLADQAGGKGMFHLLDGFLFTP